MNGNYFYIKGAGIYK